MRPVKDLPTPEELRDNMSLINIAMVKSYTYCEEYEPNSGRTQMKDGHLYLKQGYIDGFLDGFAHRLIGGSND